MSAQHPLEHEQQPEAGDAQHPQDQGVDQIDAQADADEMSHLGEKGQNGQPHGGAQRQPEQLCRRPAQKEQSGAQNQPGQASG